MMAFMRPRHKTKVIWNRYGRLALVLTLVVLVVGALGFADASVRYRIRSGDTLTSIAARYHVSIRSIVVANHMRSRNQIIYAGRILIIPTRSTAPPPKPAPRPPSGTPLLCESPHGQMPMPTSPSYISQGYTGPYPRHSGIDLAGPGGTRMNAVAGGTVIGVWYWNYSYGRHILIQHPCGQTLYAHLSTITVRVGQHVVQGQKIGTRDSTGNSTGNHLHFEVIKNGFPVNPAPWLFRNAVGGPGNPKFQGRDFGLIKPVYDWRTATDWAGRMERLIQVARAADGEAGRPLDVSGCLAGAAQTTLGNMLSSKDLANGTNALVKPNVLPIEQKCKMDTVAAIVGKGKREPGLAMYDWLLNGKVVHSADGDNHGSSPEQGAQTLSTMPNTRDAVLTPEWANMAVAQANHHGLNYEVVLFGTVAH